MSHTYEAFVCHTCEWVKSCIWMSQHSAKEPYKRDDILQKRPIILRSLLIVATPYVSHIWSFRVTHMWMSLSLTFEWVGSHKNVARHIWMSHVTYTSNSCHIMSLWNEASHFRAKMRHQWDIMWNHFVSRIRGDNVTLMWLKWDIMWYVIMWLKWDIMW